MLTFPPKWLRAGGLWPCCLLCCTVGCMYPSYGPGYTGYPYQQPMYAPPQNLTAPGTLVVPPSNAPLYSPGTNNGSTYERDPADTWQSPSGSGSSGGGMFEGNDADKVPAPKDPGAGSNSPFYNDPLNQPSTQIIPAPHIPVAAVSAASQPAVADPAATNAVGISLAPGNVAVSRPVSYGFDTTGYRWLQGVLNYHAQNGTWSITYNRSQNDTFLGDLTLLVQPQQLSNLQPGMAVQVRGQLDSSALDTRGRASYRVEQIFELPVAVAQAQAADGTSSAIQ